MPAMGPTCLIRRKQPSSSKRLPPPHPPISNSSTKGEQNEKGNKMKPTQSKPSIVFCHGIWADGSCFNKVIPTLPAEGYDVIAAQYGLDAQAPHLAPTKPYLGRLPTPPPHGAHSSPAPHPTPTHHRQS